MNVYLNDYFFINNVVFDYGYFVFVNRNYYDDFNKMKNMIEKIMDNEMINMEKNEKGIKI